MAKSASNSFERVLAVLDVFNENCLEWTPDELRRELGFSRPTVYRYLKILKDAGLLTSLPSAGYTLGPRLIEMDYLLRKSDPLELQGHQYLCELTQRHPSTALLMRWYGEKILCIDSVSSTDTLLSSYPRGRPMPLVPGAIGRSILAFLPPRRLKPLIKQLFSELQAIGMGNSLEAIYDAMRQIRKSGYVVAYGEVTPGAVGIAAPIFDSLNNPIASLCVTSGGHQVSGNEITNISRDVKRVTSKISAALAQKRVTEVA